MSSTIKGRSVLSFIQTEIKNNDSIDTILKTFDEIEEVGEIEGQPIKYSDRGFVYERLWDICVKFGLVDNLTLNPIHKDKGGNHLQTSHIFGNVNNETNVEFDLTIWNTNFKSFIEESIQSGNSGGYSDITFINKKYNNEQGSYEISETLNMISVKYFENDGKKGPDKYDIGKLCTLIEKHGKSDREIKILLFVKDKKTVQTKFEKANKSSDIMIKYINPGGNYENIYDKNDLEQHFYKLKQLLELYNYLETPLDQINFQKYLGILKQPFIPRFHQELFINKIDELLTKKYKNILVGAIPRSGKTYIMAGSILKYVKTHPREKRNFVIITPAPSETFPEYLSLFNNYIDFSEEWNIINTKEGKRQIKDIDPRKNNIIVVSKQKLGWVESNDKKIINEGAEVTLKNLNDIFPQGTKLDLIFLDEAHFGMSTQKAGTILTQLDSLCGSTPKIFVTATYKKPLETYGIDTTPDAKITWDLNDINIMKKIELLEEDNEIKTRFGKKLYEEVIKNYTLQQIKENYNVYPQPYLITSIWDYQYIMDEKLKIGDTNYGFDMEKLFTLKGATNDTFENQSSVENVLRYYFGEPDRENDYKIQHMTKHRGILPRINNICQNKCRTMQIKNKPTSQLWFMPYGQKRPIKNIINALLTLIDNRFPNIAKDFYFYVALPEKDKSSFRNVEVQYMDGTPIKKHIESIEKKITDGKITQSNLIILAGARLQLGISLKNVDIVTLWNNVMSSDAIFQMLFRSMTEVDTPECEVDTYCNNKKFGFMVDLNPQRALTNIHLFKDNLYDNKPSGNEYEAIGDLINIDDDVWKDRYSEKGGKEEFIKDMFDKLYDSWGNNSDSMKRLTRKVIKYDNPTLKRIEYILKDIKLASNIPSQSNTNVEGFNSGKKVVKIKQGSKKTKKVKKDKEISLEEKASEIMFEYLSLLNIFNLYNEGETSKKCFLEMKELQDLKSLEFERDKQHLKIFSEPQNKSIFLKILNGRLGNNDNEEFKEEVLETLISSIKSNDNKLSVNKLMKTQKKKYYSYTINEPEQLLNYINENLTPKDKERKEKGEVFTPMWLVNEMLDKLPTDVWSNWNYKWLDPAVGIGNFPIAIYLRLIEGLKKREPNEEKLRKHILEDMLFMIDISDKNIFILKKIFCGNKYKLNIHKGSFFGINKDGSDDYKIPGKWVTTFKHTTFDVIVGNPPYNKDGTGTGGGTFWKYFLELSLNILNINGYLNFVHPLGWRKPIGKKASGGDILERFKKEGQLIYVNISDKKIPYFPKVDYYVFKKETKLNHLTTVYNNFGLFENTNNIDLSKLHFIPNFVSDKSINILNKIIKKGNNFNFERHQNLQPNKTHNKTTGIPHIFYYIPEKDKYTEIFLSKEEILKMYSTKSNKQLDIPDFYSKPKIILTLKTGKKPSYLYPKYYSTQIGITTNVMYKEIEPKDKNKYLKFFGSKLILFLMKITQYSASPNHMNELKIINLIDKDKFDTLSDNPDDTEIFTKYGIIKPEEQTLIEEIVKESPKMSKRTQKAPLNNSVNQSKKVNSNENNSNNLLKLTYTKPPIYTNNVNNSGNESNGAPLNNGSNMTKKTPTISKRTQKAPVSNSGNQSKNALPTKTTKKIFKVKNMAVRVDKPNQEPLVEESDDWPEDGCVSGKVRNPNTKRCVKKCESKYKRKRIKPYKCLKK
jgi:hypothetical protein